MVGGLWQPGSAAIGVDISPDGVKLLQLRRRQGGLSVQGSSRAPLDEAIMRDAFAFGRQPTPTDGDPTKDIPSASADGQWSAPGVNPSPLEHAEPGAPAETPAWGAELTQALRSALAAGAFAGRRCVIALTDEFLRVRSVRQPKMPADEAAQAIRLEAAERLGFPDHVNVQVDWIEAGEVRQGEEVREELILVGGETQRLSCVIDAIADAGLTPIALEPAFLAQARILSRSLRRAEDANLVRLVVDVGRRQTGVIVTRGADVVFYKALEIGGERFDAAAARRLSASAESVADLRRQRMRTPAGQRDPRVDRAIFEAVRPVMRELAHEAALCLRYYSVTFFGQRPTQALLVGDEAYEPGLVDAISQALNVPAAVARPLENVALDGMGPDADRRSELAEWTVAAGLSLRSLRAALPEAIRRSRQNPAKQPQTALEAAA